MLRYPRYVNTTLEFSQSESVNQLLQFTVIISKRPADRREMFQGFGQFPLGLHLNLLRCLAATFDELVQTLLSAVFCTLRHIQLTRKFFFAKVL